MKTKITSRILNIASDEEKNNLNLTPEELKNLVEFYGILLEIYMAEQQAKTQ